MKLNQLESKIHTYIKNIRKKINSEESISLASDIYMIDEIIKLLNLDINVPEEMIIFSDENDLLIDEDPNFWINYNEMYETNKSISKLYKHLPNLTYNPTFSMINIENILILLSNFFSLYDKNIFNHYKKVLDKKLIYICPNIEDAYAKTFTLNSEKCSYILISKENQNILFAQTLAHEIIHSYINTFLYDISPKERFKYHINSLDEVYSHFIELIFIDYLKKINYDKKEIKNLKDYTNFTLGYYLSSFGEVFKNKDDLNLEDYIIYENYSYGMLIAFHYYINYHKNPDKTKQDILNMTLNSASKDKHFLLNNYSLSEEDICNPKILTKLS